MLVPYPPMPSFSDLVTSLFSANQKSRLEKRKQNFMSIPGLQNTHVS